MSVVMDKFAEIEKLDEMRKMGLLSEKDFELQKKVLLNQATPSLGQNDVYVVPKYSFIEANICFWKRLLDWKGRSTRAEYWYVCLSMFLTLTVLVFGLALYVDEKSLEFIINSIQIVVYILMLTLTIRRIHDTGHSAKFLFWPIIAILISLVLFIIPPLFIVAAAIAGIISFGVSVALFVFSILPSQPHKNRYDSEF